MLKMPLSSLLAAPFIPTPAGSGLLFARHSTVAPGIALPFSSTTFPTNEMGFVKAAKKAWRACPFARTTGLEGDWGVVVAAADCGPAIDGFTSDRAVGCRIDRPRSLKVNHKTRHRSPLTMVNPSQNLFERLTEQIECRTPQGVGYKTGLSFATSVRIRHYVTYRTHSC